MSWPLLPPASRFVFHAAAAVCGAAMLAYSVAVPDAGYVMPVVLGGMMAAMVFMGQFVRLSRAKRLTQIVNQIMWLSERLVDSNDAVQMSAFLFEARQVSAEAMRVCEGLDDAALLNLIRKEHGRFAAMFESASSGIRPTADNIRVFQDTLKDLGRHMSDHV